MSATTMTTEQWPGWARALLIAQFALVLAVLIPWLLMWTAMAAGCMGMGHMQMPNVPMMPGR
jgi:hypothetical protein